MICPPRRTRRVIETREDIQVVYRLLNYSCPGTVLASDRGNCHGWIVDESEPRREPVDRGGDRPRGGTQSRKVTGDSKDNC